MDGHTEPLVAVIGNPIAGNPSQFAIEFAIKSLDLEFRVTSFHVLPQNIDTALDGLQVLGYRGVLVDDALATRAGAWSQQVSLDDYAGTPVNCLSRNDDNPDHFVASDTHGQWLSERINQHFSDHEVAIESCLWLGNRNKKFPRGLVSPDITTLSTRTPPIDCVAQANLIVLSPGPKGDVALDINEWPEDDGSTLIVDLTDGNREIGHALENGYTVISSVDRQVGTILQSVQRWTGGVASETIVHDAIEEYLSV